MTVLVSRADGAAGAAANGESRSPVISGDGCRIAFASRATNLAADDPNATTNDLFVRDVCAGATTLVSHIPGEAGTTPASRK